MKGLKSQNLRDHMSEAELIFTALAELSTRQIAENVDATGMPQNKTAAKAGGRIARQARNQMESQAGKSVVSGGNYLPPAAEKLTPALGTAAACRAMGLWRGAPGRHTEQSH